MTINTTDGAFQASYWRDPEKIGGDPDAVEYADYATVLKQRIHTLFRAGEFAYAALFQWHATTEEWELLDEFARRDGARVSGGPERSGEN